MTQLTLARDRRPAPGDYKGVVELTVNPGVPDAKVSILVDGQKLAEGLRLPYRVTVDFGATAIEHRITIVAVTPNKKRIQWHETINAGNLSLQINLRPEDMATRSFEASVTAPDSDPVQTVELWHEGKVAMSLTAPPYRFVVPEDVFSSGFLQVTARTRSGEEAADFWSFSGEVHAESVDVRTVPIFVSVVDRNGQTRDDIDRSLFRIIDNEAEGKIIEFGKAFDQPISIALLLDASASMTYLMPRASRAASGFVERALKNGDRCSVLAVSEVPRRVQPLTGDTAAVGRALEAIQPHGRTALYDAIASAVRELRGEKNRRAIVALTDGLDTASMTTFEEAETLLREAGIPIYFIAYDSGDEDWLRNIDRLRYLASQSGGFVATATEQDLQARYSAIERDLRAQFAITYQVMDVAKRNEWRKVKVVMSSPKLTARTIRGYYTP